jgi:hypothetical protein
LPRKDRKSVRDGASKLAGLREPLFQAEAEESRSSSQEAKLRSKVELKSTV